MEKDYKNLKFNFQGKGKLKKAKSPIGEIWVNETSRVFLFQGEEDAFKALRAFLELASVMEDKDFEALNFIVSTFYRLSENDVRILGDNIFFEISVQGELEPIVATPFGVLYANFDKEIWYFQATHKESLPASALDFTLFMAFTRRHAEKDENAKLVIALLKKFTLVSGTCIEEE